MSTVSYMLTEILADYEDLGGQTRRHGLWNLDLGYNSHPQSNLFIC